MHALARISPKLTLTGLGEAANLFGVKRKGGTVRGGVVKGGAVGRGSGGGATHKPPPPCLHVTLQCCLAKDPIPTVSLT